LHSPPLPHSFTLSDASDQVRHRPAEPPGARRPNSVHSLYHPGVLAPAHRNSARPAHRHNLNPNRLHTASKSCTRPTPSSPCSPPRSPSTRRLFALGQSGLVREDSGASRSRSPNSRFASRHGHPSGAGQRRIRSPLDSNRRQKLEFPPSTFHRRVVLRQPPHRTLL
jgi:hypothetical protein